MWFKNLYLFHFDKPFTQTAEQLHESLEKKPFSPCHATQRESAGWVSPFGRDNESLVHAAGDAILFSLARQERLLPASVIRETLDEKVADIEMRENRKVAGKEKKALREAIEHELLPRAFTRTVRLDAWIDKNNGWLIVNTASAPRAEELTKLLRTTLGSLPVTLVDTEIAPAAMMTNWLEKAQPASPFLLGSECELKNQGEDKGVAAFRHHELASDEIRSNLESGKYVSRLELEWDGKIRFVLGEDMQLRKLRFLDVLDEQRNESDPETHEEYIDIEFTLMSGEVAQMLNDLMRHLH